MMYILHGDDIISSRNELYRIKQQFIDSEIIILNGKTVSLTDLIQASQSLSLIKENRLVIVENLLTQKLNVTKNSHKPLIYWLNNIHNSIHIIFWEEKELAKKQLSIFSPKVRISLFRIKKQIFNFLDSIKPDNTKNTLQQFNESLLYYAPEIIMVMLVRQLRYLIMIKDLGRQITDLTSWQISKLYQQSQYFTMKQLLILYRLLYEIDVKIKFGQSTFNLSQELKLFLYQI